MKDNNSGIDTTSGSSSYNNSPELEEQKNTASNKRLAETGVKGLSTAAGTYLGGAEGAKIGAKVGDAINKSAIGDKLTTSVGNSLTKLNRNSVGGQVLQKTTNSLADSGTLDAADSTIDMAAGGSSKSPINNSIGSNNAGSISVGTSNNPYDNSSSSYRNKQGPKGVSSSKKLNKQNSSHLNSQRSGFNTSMSQASLSSNDDLVTQDTENTSEEDEEVSSNLEKKEQEVSFGTQQKKKDEKRNVVFVVTLILKVLTISLLIIIIFFLPVLLIVSLIGAIVGIFGENRNGVFCINEPTCDQVIIEDGPNQGTYTLDEYLVGAVNYYFKDYKNEDVYAAMGIVIHQDLIRNSNKTDGGATCTISSTNNYPEIDYIDMSNPNEDISEEDLTNEEKKEHRKIISQVTSYVSKTFQNYNNPSLEEVDYTALHNGNITDIIKNYLKLNVDDFEIVEICDKKEKFYINSCNSVEIIEGDFAGEIISFDDYIAGVVSREVGGFNDLEVYKAFAVAARSYLLSHVRPSNGVCKVSNTTNFQTYRPTTDSLIYQAVKKTNGQVLMKNDNVVNTMYDAFCWNEKDDNYFTLIQQNQKIPAFWVLENVNSIYYSNRCGQGENKGHGQGMSQYGSYYLATALGYDYNQILNYYYGAVLASTTDNDSEGSGQIVIIDGQTASKEGYIIPLASFFRITGEATVNGQGGYCGSGFKHRGMDLAAPSGTPIYSAHDGVIINGSSCGDWSYGNCVKIANSDGTVSLYAHMSETMGLGNGTSVAAGQQIGKVGSTGNSTGPHLHYEMRRADTWSWNDIINPRSYLPLDEVGIGYCGRP